MQVIETMTVQEIYQEMSKLGIKTSPQKIRKAIEQGKYPFAISIKMETHELEKLVYEHPVYIPVPVVAAFLGANADGLRNCIEHGQCPFGIAWQKDVRGYKAFKIPTLTFYNWYTRGISYESTTQN